jgi:hypothetical protein
LDLVVAFEWVGQVGDETRGVQKGTVETVEILDEHLVVTS